MEGLRRALVAVAAGLALADASIVALALPPILTEMDTTITGVAAIIGVYALVLALAIWPPRGCRVGPWGFALFALASLGCGSRRSACCSSSARCRPSAAPPRCSRPSPCCDAGVSRPGRRLWLGAALVGTAAGPAIGGVLTEVFDWRAIFIVQAPFAAAARSRACGESRAWPPAGATAAARASARCSARPGAARARAAAATRRPARLRSRDRRARRRPRRSRDGPRRRRPRRPRGRAPRRAAIRAARAGPRRPREAAPRAAPPAGPARRAARGLACDAPARVGRLAVWLAALAFTAAAFTAVLFLLVIELVAGFAMSPIEAALGVTVLPSPRSPPPRSPGRPAEGARRARC